MRRKFGLKLETAGTAAWPSGARNLFRAAALPAATAAKAAMSSWNPANATTRWCTFASIRNTKPSAAAIAAGGPTARHKLLAAEGHAAVAAVAGLDSNFGFIDEHGESSK